VAPALSFREPICRDEHPRRREADTVRNGCGPGSAVPRRVKLEGKVGVAALAWGSLVERG